MSNHNCDECGADLGKTYFCSNAHRMRYLRRKGPTTGPAALIADLRARTEEIITRPEKNSVSEVTPKKKKPDLDPFFEDDVVKTD